MKIADTIRAAAETETAALKDRALRDIDAAKQQALSARSTRTPRTWAPRWPGKILQRDMTAGDQQRLVDESLAEMAKKN